MTQKTYNDVPVVQMTPDDYHELAADAPELIARRDARAAADAETLSISVPLGVWRAILPAIAQNLAGGVQHMRMHEAMMTLAESATPEEGEEAARAEDLALGRRMLAKDRELAKLQRFFIGEWTRQLGEAASDPFFAVDGAMVLAELDEKMRLAEFAIDKATAEELLSPANVRAELEELADMHRKAENEAKNEVADELARFARDIDTSGKTLN